MGTKRTQVLSQSITRRVTQNYFEHRHYSCDQKDVLEPNEERKKRYKYGESKDDNGFTMTNQTQIMCINTSPKRPNIAGG